MKYWRGYIVAAIIAAITAALTAFAKSHTVLIDMFYPYTSRLIQTSLASWSGGADFCLWQMFVVILAAVVLASIVIMIVLRWNFVQWLGWMLTGAATLFFLHTGVYGLNNYAGPLADDIRLTVRDVGYNVSELVEATTYFRDIANELSQEVPRNADGSVDYPTFEEMAEMAGEGFETLTYEEYFSVFAGSTLPVKKLGWADMYTSMGITGVTMPLTGEAAVNPQIPAVTIPFVMCHEMAHRMCISLERDANLAAFLATDAHSDPIFRYSGYYMALRYCYGALASVGTTSADAAIQTLYSGMTAELRRDLADYDNFFSRNKNDAATNLATNANDAYIKASGDEDGVSSYDQVSDLLVSWYIQEIYLPAHKEEDETFDPLDKDWVDLTTNPTVGGSE
ncbi:MAG: DUF3810 domain-containing protein [Oscillospiraceae bacterium]|nr:DUF3810 domain-containing protein [Oscillospiraceae bacterium]